MKISISEICRTINFLKENQSFSAERIIRSDIDETMLNKITDRLDAIPEVRKDAVDELKKFIKNNKSVPSHKIAEKLLGRVISDQIR